jgi:hypothetical protein
MTVLKQLEANLRETSASLFLPGKKAICISVIILFFFIRESPALSQAHQVRAIQLTDHRKKPASSNHRPHSAVL